MDCLTVSNTILVQLDCADVTLRLQGSSTVLRADVVMDIGRSINPSVDIGEAGRFALKISTLTCHPSLQAKWKAHGCRVGSQQMAHAGMFADGSSRHGLDDDGGVLVAEQWTAVYSRTSDLPSVFATRTR